MAKMEPSRNALCWLLAIWLTSLKIGLLHAEDDEAKIFPLLMPDVQPLQEESYLCTAFKMPRYDHEYIVEFHPNATMHTAHHILIYGCKIPGRWQRDTPRLVWDCGEMSGSQSGFERGPTCTQGSQIIYAWAKEAPALTLPEGVGFKVGGNSDIDYLVLQVHYATVEKFRKGGTDNSGIILSILPSSTNAVTKSAGVFLLGTGGGIPARRTAYMETACRMKHSKPIYPFAFRTHTHALGKVVSGFRIDKQGKWTLIGKHNPQEPQMFYPVEDKSFKIQRGDIVAARCTMKNFRDKNTYIGSTTDDEMCNFYMMYYVDGEEPMKDKYCFSTGPPSYYWAGDSMIQNVPNDIDVQASSLEGEYWPMD